MASPTGPSVTSTTSPASNASSADPSANEEVKRRQKRERDRKSQQAMRDRTKFTIETLNEQVALLSQTLDERTRSLDETARILEQRTRDVYLFDSRVRQLESDNAQLRTHNAALQLSLIGYTNAQSQSEAGSARSLEPNFWEVPPLNTPPSCLADQILQRFLDSKTEERILSPEDAARKTTAYSSKPSLVSLLHKGRRTDDDISNVVGDIIRSYFEIDTLPKQVASFYIMATLLKWRVLMDKRSWELMPDWLRPTSSQLTTPHAAWIDRLPWPKVREYLVGHPEITLDEFAVTYSTSFSVTWPYDPSHILISSANGADGGDVSTNPVYEEHIRQLENWTVAEAFRNRFPQIATRIDES